ncbi:uncharacterized protein LOC129000695 [Macrosteles quadrilineatus]|uniref:uncharacterized protein LOC129000695 n=1 Tax=Macrosteles quadrilineatus TaxID=74068 RepID=UPI0023E2C2D6|nr:uncharacterized protein LOC129000695 [Macrosteles quadrilineatus]
MAEPRCEDEGILREWAPLSRLLREVPLTVRRGLYFENVSLTCVDALPEYLAVGTNIGVVYWYNRENHNLQRLRPEKNTFKITCVKLVSSVDYMVAAGDESGTVTVFRIPKPTPEWIKSIYKQTTASTNVERYTVGGLHSTPVTALEWSTNGQKLFSGDATGLVVLTEIDFYMNLSKACEILNEKYRVVQLSYNQQCQVLVVATEYRCISAHRPDSGSWKVAQVGQQERRRVVQLSYNQQCQVLVVATEYRCISAHRPDSGSWKVAQVGQQERRRVVQLSYNQQCQVLVVATEYRCISAHRPDSGSWKVSQVGQQERRRVVQLSYNQQCQVLVVATEYRCISAHRPDSGSWKVSQVGQQERRRVVQLSYNQQCQVLVVATEYRCISAHRPDSGSWKVSQVGQQERRRVVQLSYNQQCQVLVVATEYRCISAHRPDSGSWKVSQVGQQERRRVVQLSYNQQCQVLVVATEYRCISAHRPDSGSWKVSQVGQQERRRVVQLSYNQQCQVLVVATEYRCISAHRPDSGSWKVSQVGQQERRRVVQLSYNQQCQVLVVATEYRCISAHRPDSGSWKVSQVGQQERHSLCRVGATFFVQPQKPLERTIYSGRAGLRFWQSDSSGTVHKTLIFKDAIKKPHQLIRLLHPPPVREGVGGWEGELGVVMPWKGLYLVSHNSSGLVVLDPQRISVVACVYGLTDVHSMAVTASEIFIIAGSRNIMRLSYLPDVYGGSQEEPVTSLFDELKVSPVTETFLDLTSRLKQTANDLVSKRPVTTVSGTLLEEDEEGTDALDSLDLPPVLPVEGDVLELTLQKDPRTLKLDEIGKQSFDDVLYSSTRKVKTKNSKQSKAVKASNSNVAAPDTCSDTASVASVRSGESEESESNNNNNNNVGEQPRLSLDLVSSSTLSAAIPPDILPDLRSPDSIMKDVHDKEILVAKAFNLEEVLLAAEKHFEKEENETEGINKDCLPELLSGVKHIEETLNYGPPSGSSSAIPSLEAGNNTVPQYTVLRQDSIDHPLADDVCGTVTSDDTLTLDCNDGWCQVTTPEVAQYVSVCRDYVVMSGPSRTLHSTTVPPASPARWSRLGYRAMDVLLSPEGQLVWKLDFDVAAALLDSDNNGTAGGNWEIAARGVESVALGSDVAWYVSSGRVYLQTELSSVTPYRDGSLVPCPSLVTSICCSKEMVWVLTADHWVLWRAGVTPDCPEGSHWQRVDTPGHVQVADIALGPYNLGWLVDRSNSVYYSDNYMEDKCVWWQVLIRNYMFENSSLCQISSNNNSVWITNRMSPYVYVNSTAIKGHRWTEVSLRNMTAPLRWRQITAEGVFEEKGSLWLLSTGNELFHLRPNSENLNVVNVPCSPDEVMAVTAAPHALWLLTDGGQIYVRQGMGDQNPQGDQWRALNIEQISDKQVTLRHVSIGCDVIWACDTKGDIYMAVGSPYLIATDTFSPAWVLVEGRPLSNTVFVKVFVGSETHIVWAVDNKSNIYVRSGIFHDFQLGTDWVLVSGVKASHLSISGSSVWALSTSGGVFCRAGISENNYIGNYWYQVPGALGLLTASVSEGLWGVLDKGGSLAVYQPHMVSLTEEARSAASTDKDDDWEVI